MAGTHPMVRRTTRISIDACMGVGTRWPVLDARLWDTPGHVSRAHPNGGRGVGARSRPRQGEADEARGRGGARRPDWPPGLAQDPPVRAGRGERPTGVGRPGGGALPCGARLLTPRARPDSPAARLPVTVGGRPRTAVMR